MVQIGAYLVNKATGTESSFTESTGQQKGERKIQVMGHSGEVGDNSRIELFRSLLHEMRHLHAFFPHIFRLKSPLELEGSVLYSYV